MAKNARNEGEKISKMHIFVKKIANRLFSARRARENFTCPLYKAARV